MEAVIPGMITWEALSQRLSLDRRQLQRLQSESVLGRIAPIPLGRGIGTARLFPLLAVPLLRQLRSRTPRRLPDWHAALADLVSSASWHDAVAQISRSQRAQHLAFQWQDRQQYRGVEALLLSAAFLEPLDRLQHEILEVLNRHGLTEEFQVEELLVDRLDEEEDAVILLGSQQQHAYLLPRSMLVMAGIAYETARGMLTATRTGSSIELDVWPRAGAAGEPAWQPDPALLAMRVVAATRGPRGAYGTHPGQDGR